MDARGDGTGVGDRVTAAVEELYDGDLAVFIERRAALAAEAKSADDRTAAQAIGALRRPTRAAWVVNRLARADPSAPLELAELAAALRAAQQAGHGPRLRELSAARSALVDALTRQAFSAAGVTDPPSALLLEVSQTLTAALADPEVAADFAAGTLTRAAQWSGFGVLPASVAEGAGQEGQAAAAGAETAGHEAAPAAPSPRLGVVTRGQSRSRRAEGAKPSPEAAARRQAEEDERLAREAAERAAHHREQYEEAERTVASTAAAAADVLAAEDRLEREVRELEERLTRARADLAGTRMRARQADAAERRARQALDRLPRP